MSESKAEAEPPAPAQGDAAARLSAGGRAMRLARLVLAIDEIGVLGALVALMAVIGAFHPDFLGTQSLLDTARAASYVGLVAYGMVFMIAMTELDLSVGAVYGVSALVAGKLMADGMNPWFSLVVGPLVGIVLETFNGLVSNMFRIPVIIVSIGTLSAFGGLETVITSSQALSNLPLKSGFFTVLGDNVLGVPTSVWIVALVGVVLTFVLTRTPFGARVRAVGSNQEAARFAGIRVEWTRLQALWLLGALCGLSGVLSLAYYEGADATLGSGLELPVIAATIIGGTAISGGSGSVPGALIGALVITTISAALVFFSVSTNLSDVVTGSVVVIAVSVDGFIRRRRTQRLARTRA